MPDEFNNIPQNNSSDNNFYDPQHNGYSENNETEKAVPFNPETPEQPETDSYNAQSNVQNTSDVQPYVNTQNGNYTDNMNYTQNFADNQYNINQNSYPNNINNPMSYQQNIYNQNPNIPPNYPQNMYTFNRSGYHYPSANFANGNKPPKKSSGLKVALWCVSSVLGMVLIAVVIFMINERFSDNSNNNIIPNNSGVESSYGTASSLPDAPSVGADENGPQISTQEAPTSESSSANTTNNAYKKASPSVVCITSYESGTDYALTESGEGSGIIISSDGYIATNSHVVNDDKNTGVMITLNTGKQYLGTIIGIDKKTDLAVIKIDAKNLTAADFANSDKLIVGQDVYAIGNPGGSAFSNSLTKGAVSALNRVLSSNVYVKYVQTDAAINPGNSGGALINEYGQVVGMNTSKLVGTDYEGMGFAIPSNTVAQIVNKIIKYGYVNDRGTLGIEGTTCTLYASKANNIPQGMIITKINSNSPLYSTQAKEKDIITAINGKTVLSSTEFIDQMKKYKPGDKVSLTLFRASENSSGKPYSYTLDVVLISDTGS